MSESFRSEIHEMCQKTAEMLRLTWEGFRKQATGPLLLAEKLGQEIRQREKTLTERALAGLVVKRPVSQGGARGADQEIFFVPMHVERIGQNIEFLITAIKTMVQEGVPFTERAVREVNTVFGKAIEIVECIRDAMPTKNTVLIKHILEEGQRYEEMANEYATVHQQRLVEGICVPKASSIYVAILDYLKGIEWHTRQIAQKL